MMIEILMATYNGEGYLRGQWESLLAQTHGDWRLLVRDDGSTDGTVSILEGMRAEYPERIEIVRDDPGRLGAAGNFLRLLELASGPYIMFCDQDDVWLPEKISLSLDALQAAVRDWPGVPLLVHSDLIVVDADLNRIADSYWHWRRVRIDAQDPLRSIIHLNGVTGCTILMNRAARDISLPVPACVRLHDWWVALNVASRGRIVSLEQPTVLYRQHARNAIGAGGGLSSPVRWLARLARFPERLRRDYRTAKQIVPGLSFLSWSARATLTLLGRHVGPVRGFGRAAGGRG